MAKSIHVFMLILVMHFLEPAFAKNFFSLSHADECFMLFQFKDTMLIDKYASTALHAYPKVASWNLNRSNCCLWDGVECSFGHVIGLDLSSSFLYGPISSNNSLFNLIHFRTLNLADNNFNLSQIPSEIGRLSRLENLNLSYSSFNGDVPKQISQLSKLVSLDLSGNQLKLQSFDFQNLVQNSSETLRELFLSYVNISELPARLVNCSLLTSLALSDCGLGGEFPKGIFNLKKLQLLDVKNNDLLTGYIPEFYGISELEHLLVANTNFQGSIPASIGNLTHLNTLNLFRCAFTGDLPASVSNLTQLTVLDLCGNELTGTLPSLENLSNLSYLTLSRNNFDRWKLPEWFGKLKKITYLDLHVANLYGEIPSSFFNMTQVGNLYLSSNQFKGHLSSSLLNFQNLEVFYLNGNNVTVDFHLVLSLKKLRTLDLSGNNITLSAIYSSTYETQPQFQDLELASCNLKLFPDFLRFQHELLYLVLNNNMLTGEIPPYICDMPSLQVLDLSFNNITGSIPPCLEKLSNYLVELNLRSNTLEGTIPNKFNNQSMLQMIDLSENKLMGPIPRSLENCESLRILDLSRNNLQGTIPNIFTNKIWLQMIDLSDNKLEGQVPTSLVNCKSLRILILRRNTLQGTIPSILTNVSKLTAVDLSENKFVGEVPSSLEKCTLLQVLDLGYNFIEDMFPYWLGTLSELQVLILRFNKFHGIIRTSSKIKVNFPKLRIIDLSYNSFAGDLPHQYFHEWSAMKATKADPTYMETDVGDYIIGYMKGYWFSIQLTNKGVKTNYVKIINSFVAVDLSSNMFRGKIPESIKTLSGLQLLNLSNNELDGVIPQSMGNLMHLESLDLSSNKLSGMIPQDLVQLNFLEFLNVSNNNLTGPIPQGRQFNTFLNNSYMGNQALCGLPLSMKCGGSNALKPTKVTFEEDTESDFPNGIDWAIIIIGVVSGLVIGLVCGNHLATRFSNLFLQRFTK